MSISIASRGGERQYTIRLCSCYVRRMLHAPHGRFPMHAIHRIAWEISCQNVVRAIEGSFSPKRAKIITASYL